jgi:hypothetical protein
VGTRTTTLVPFPLERHYVEDIETTATRAGDLTGLLPAVRHKTPEPAR